MVTSYQGKLKDPERQHFPHVKEFMSRSFIRFAPETDIFAATKEILAARVTGAPVVDDQDRLIGMISERDCLKLINQSSYDNVLAGGPIENYMTPGTDCVTVTLESGLDEVARIFLQHGFKKIPVIDGEKLVGLVRRSDALRALNDFYKQRQKFMNRNN